MEEVLEEEEAGRSISESVRRREWWPDCWTRVLRRSIG